jgi:hypothetical protein
MHTVSSAEDIAIRNSVETEYHLPRLARPLKSARKLKWLRGIQANEIAKRPAFRRPVD